LITWGVGITIVGIIVLLAIFFFEPVVKKMNEYIEEIEKQTKKLKASEIEMREIAEKQLEANEQLFLAQRQLQQKNAELEASEKETKRLLEEQEKANQKLAVAQRELQKNLVEQNRANQKLVEAQKEIEQSEKQMRALAEAQLEANEQLFLAQRKEKERQQKLEKFNGILNTLARTSFEQYGSLDNAMQAITEALANGLEIDRASIWDYTGKSIISHDLYEKNNNQHSKGTELFATDFPAYFDAVKNGLVINAQNAHTHPNTFEFSDVYLTPLGINSMLDIPIRVGGELAGVVCCEYVGSDYKEWNIEDENFARGIADIISLTIEADKRQKAQQELAEALENQKIINESLTLAQRELARRSEELERSEKEMRMLAEAQLEANEQLFLAQKQIQEQAQKMKQAFIIAKSGAWVLEANLDGSSAIMTLSDEYFAILNTSIEEQGKYEFPFEEWMSKFVIPEDHSIITSCLGSVLQNAEYSTNIEVRLKHSTLGFIYTNTVISTRHDVKTGKVIGQGTAQDVTERKKAEEELSLVTDRLNLAISGTNDGIWDWDIVKNEVYFSPRWKTMLGYEDNELENSFDTFVALQHPEDVPLVNEKIRDYLEGKTSVYTVELRMKAKDGNYKWIQARGIALRDEEGKPYRMAGSHTDIDERKKLEEELKQALENQKIVNESLMLAQKELVRRSEEIEKSEREMRLLAEAQLEANERLMMAEKNLKDTLELEKKQKAELDRLVSQLKDTQTQLVHNEKMASLGQLTAGIAHEINNPINFVYNGIDTLKISLDDLMEIVNKYNELDQANGNKEEIIEEVKALKNDLDYEELIGDINHLVSDIKKGAVRTMEIVKGLRVFSRLDEEERKMASIKDCLESTLILLNNKIKNKINLKTFYDESMPEILCYPGQLNQVFMNIINNAIQAIPEEKKDGEIVIYTENLQENVVIRIKDNGVGMSEQVKRRIFEPFFTTKQVGVGTGLGLSITFGIIEKHGGSIFVNSEEGRGTEFVIQLPKVSH
jgi:PAS domain S-box-containing protein